MPNNTISRDSLIKTIEDRYDTQSAGGAFNAQKINTSSDSISLQSDPSYSGQKYTTDKGGFRVKQPIGVSNYAGVSDGLNSRSKIVSSLAKGLNTDRYK